MNIASITRVNINAEKSSSGLSKVNAAKDNKKIKPIAPGQRTINNKRRSSETTRNNNPLFCLIKDLSRVDNRSIYPFEGADMIPSL